MVRRSGLEKERRLDDVSPTREEVIEERRQVIKKGVYLAASGALFATTAGSLGAFIPPYVNPFVDGTYNVVFSTSGATSAWANAKEGDKMLASDFPEPGLGAQGIIPELAMNVLVVYLRKDKVAPTMKGTIDYGAGTFAVYNAKCKHLGCAALWRNAAEAMKLVPLTLDHDIIVCPCHLGTYDIYNSAKVRFGPPPQPLDQLKFDIVEGDAIQVTFSKYKYGKNITGGQV